MKIGEEKQLVSRHVQFYKEDWELLDWLFGQRSKSQLGVGKAVRKIVARHCQAIRVKRAEGVDQFSIPDRRKGIDGEGKGKEP